VPQFSDPDLDYRVDFNTGVVTVTPKNGLTGVTHVTVATAANPSAADYQVVPITIEP
jgi:hypothetical protein